MNYRPTRHHGLQELTIAVATAASLAATGVAKASTPGSQTTPMSPSEVLSHRSPASCFLSATGADAQAVTPDRASSTLFIVNRSDTSTMSLATQEFRFGSGFIVADSHGHDGLNRIVTDQHVTNSAMGKDGKGGYLVYDSTARLLGTAAVESSGGWNKPVDKSEMPFEKSRLNDVAVLKMTSFVSPALERAFRAKAGFPLAPQQSPDVIYFTADAPQAVPNAGTSGGPVFDKQGRVVGVVEGFTADALSAQGKAPSQAAGHGNIVTALRNNERLPSGLTYQYASPAGTTLVAPLSNQKIDAALNEAGKRIQRTPLALTLSVTALGFSDGNCTAYQGRVADPDGTVPAATRPQAAPKPGMPTHRG